MRRSEQLFLVVILGLGFLAVASSQDSGSANISGHIQLGSSTTPLLARLYSPKVPGAQSQQTSQQPEVASRRVRVAYIGADGRFEFPSLRPGSYLLEIYSGDRLLYQKVVSTQDTQPIEIAFATQPGTGQPPTVFQRKGWVPADLTANAASGVFVLDKNGGVSKLVAAQKGPQIENLFRTTSNTQLISLSASADSVYALASPAIGCTVYRYSLGSKAVSKRLLAPNERCFGVATDGTALYFTMPARNEIWFVDSWDSSSLHRWSLADVAEPGYLIFDNVGHRLIVTDTSGKAYAVSLVDGKTQFLASNLGVVQSISTSKSHILAASGTKILFLARSDNRGENPPPALQTLTGGHIVGVTVDADDAVWFADYDNRLVKGPVPLN